ncbi:MAG: type II toxin-antitoxin system RelE/ParE family toxin [Lachnospiraceae bacterium]|nr:type II toxin-antitoxin system RelE/ParE family toxin [Lachnospiraceae bacterium]
MIYKIKITDRADEDIRNIYEYIAYELQAPENASGQLDRIEQCIMSLDRMPERFRFYEKEPWKSRGLHIVPVDNYCVLYIVDSESMIVSIIRVMYGGRDIAAQLKKSVKSEQP